MAEELGLPRPRIDPDLILRLQKYRNLDRVPPVVKEAARRMASLAEAVVEPRGWMRREPVSAVEADGSVWLAGGIRFQSRALARLLQNAVEAVLIVLTIGPALEQHADELAHEEQLAEALLLDTAGRVAVDALIKEVRRRLRDDGWKRGFRLTARMAPGFVDWALDQQRVLFAAFGTSALTVELTENCIMLPRKSVSGIYGLAPFVGA
jgi:Vitamin B12 dependent methionine synthase, activation domain